MEEKAFPPNTKLLGIKRLDNVMKKPVKLSFLEKMMGKNIINSIFPEVMQ